MEGKERTQGQRGAGRARVAGGARATHLGGQGRDAGGAAGGSWRCADAPNLPRRDEPQRSQRRAEGPVSGWASRFKGLASRARGSFGFGARGWRTRLRPRAPPPSSAPASTGSARSRKRPTGAAASTARRPRRPRGTHGSSRASP